MAVAGPPQAIVINPSGDGYVALAGDILRIDGATGNLSDAKPTSLKADGFNLGSPAGIARVGNAVWFADKSGKQVREIKAGSINTTQDFAFGEAPNRLLADGQNNLWIADSVERKVGILKAGATPFSDMPFTVTLLGIPDDLLVDLTGTGWALVSENDVVHVAKLTKTQNGNDLSGLSNDRETKYDSLASGKGLALDDQNNLWVTAVTKGGVGHLMKIDGATGTPTVTYNLAFIPGRFAIRGGFAWIPDVSASGNQIHKVSLATGAVLNSYSLGGKGLEVFEDSSGDLWIPLEANSSIVKLDF
jgi:streptogramin lyase